MRVTVGGTRLVSDMRTGMVASGKRYSRPSALLPSPRTIWNGNPFCDPGCVLYLPGLPGSGATTYDYSGLKNNGAITGAVWTKLSSGLWVLTFDGADDVITLAANTKLDNLSALTLITWVNPTSAGEGNYGTMLCKQSATWTLGFNWCLNAALGIIFGVDYLTIDLSRAAADASVTLGIKQMLALTWDGSATATNIHHYVNAIETSYGTTQDGSGARQDDSTSVVRVGNDTAGGRTWDGLIGDCLIYNRVLTVGEIMRNYLSTKWRYS